MEIDLLRAAAGAHIHGKRSVPWKLTRQFADLCSEPPGSLGQKATVNFKLHLLLCIAAFLSFWPLRIFLTFLLCQHVTVH